MTHDEKVKALTDALDAAAAARMAGADKVEIKHRVAQVQKACSAFTRAELVEVMRSMLDWSQLTEIGAELMENDK